MQVIIFVGADLVSALWLGAHGYAPADLRILTF